MPRSITDKSIADWLSIAAIGVLLFSALSCSAVGTRPDTKRARDEAAKSASAVEAANPSSTISRPAPLPPASIGAGRYFDMEPVPYRRLASAQIFKCAENAAIPASVDHVAQVKKSLVEFPALSGDNAILTVLRFHLSKGEAGRDDLFFDREAALKCAPGQDTVRTAMDTIEIFQRCRPHPTAQGDGGAAFGWKTIEPRDTDALRCCLGQGNPVIALIPDVPEMRTMEPGSVLSSATLKASRAAEPLRAYVVAGFEEKTRSFALVDSMSAQSAQVTISVDMNLFGFICREAYLVDEADSTALVGSLFKPRQAAGGNKPPEPAQQVQP